MASNFTPKHVSSSQLLAAVSPAVLYRFMKKYSEYFESEKVMPSSAREIDHDRLSLVFATPNEAMPPRLMADLFYWDEVAEMGELEDLNEIAERHGIKFGDEVTVEEAALLVRMNAPDDLEDLHAAYHAHGLLRRKKRFLSYFATVEKLPKWKKPTTQQLNRFAQDMDAWYESQKKGLGTRVSLVERDGAAWFIVRHGGTFKRENAVKNGQPDVVFYRPEAYDLLIYYHADGELAIYNESNGKRERRAYCERLGKCLFKNATFFEQQDAAKFTLEPLREHGRDAMDCSEIPGLKAARLTYFRYQFGGANNHCVTHKAEDVFTGLENIGEEIPEGALLVCMGVKLTPDNDIEGERTVKLYWPNVSVYDHERDAELAHRFLAEQGFILPRNNGEGGTANDTDG